MLLLASAGLQAAEQPLDLETPTGTIRGTLTTPAGASKSPVVLIVAGSGPTDRNGNSPLLTGRNDSLQLLAQALATAGFASLRYDKRGIAGSAAAGASERDLRIDDYVNDAALWVRQLAKDSRFTGVAILGHSEGSLIGMLAAQRSPAQAFVSVAGPAEQASAILRRQLLGRLPADLAARSDAILAALEAGNLVDDVPPQLLALYRPSVQPYLVSWFQYTPSQELARLRIPCLVLQGDTDIQVGVPDAQALHAARPECGLTIVPGMNHVMKLVAADRPQQIASYADPSLPIAEPLVRALEQFLSRSLGTPAPRR
jgi:pimeloyl-ACP methyl ester carboxylesterase